MRIPAHSSSKTARDLGTRDAPVSAGKLPVTGEPSEAYVQAKQGEASAMSRRRRHMTVT